MALENKLGITDSAELAREEEKISKKKALWLFESGTLDSLKAGTFAALQEIHKCLFEELYDFAGKIRTVNLAKGNSGNLIQSVIVKYAQTSWIYVHFTDI